MSKRKKAQKKTKTGLPPGSLVFTGEQKIAVPNLSIWTYNEQLFKEAGLVIKEIPIPSGDLVNWYDIKGLHDVSLIEQIGKIFTLHPLLLEDVLNPLQRPKFDEYQDGIFLIARAIFIQEQPFKIKAEQIAMYFNKDTVVTFQEDEYDTFYGVRERISAAKGKIRGEKVDYLVYALLDNMVDHYYTVLDKVGDKIDALEVDILGGNNNHAKADIYQLKREMLTLRRAVVPLREVVNQLSRTDNKLIQDSTKFFIKDLYDHVIQIIDSIEIYRDSLTSLHDLYLSEISFQTNKIMQILTIISTIFIPLTFLAGIYGMNFEHMPELHWKYGYALLWCVMIVLASVLLFYFRKRKWI